MQPLMNMITFTARNREKIIALHTTIADEIESQRPEKVEHALTDLSTTKTLASDVIKARLQQKTMSDNTGGSDGLDPLHLFNRDFSQNILLGSS